MTRFIPPLIIGATTGGSDAGMRLIEGQHIGLTTAITIAISVAGLGIWLEHRLSRIETRMDSLPCIGADCPFPKRKKKRK